MTQAFGTYDPSEAMRGASDAGGRDGVRVEKLEWYEPDDHLQDREDAVAMAFGIGGRYSISTRQSLYAGGDGHLLWWAHDEFEFAEFHTVDAAKAAAQQDFERRVLSCITDAPQPVQGSQAEADIERLRAALVATTAIVRLQNGNLHDDVNAILVEADAALAALAPSSGQNAEASLRAALERIADQSTINEMESLENADFEGGYEAIVCLARATLKGSRT